MEAWNKESINSSDSAGSLEPAGLTATTRLSKSLLCLMIGLAVLGGSSMTLAASWADIKAKAINAPALNAAKADIESAVAAVDNSKAGFYPRVYSTLQASRLRDEPSKLSSNNFSAALNLEQSLFSSGRDQAHSQAATASLDAAKLAFKDASVTLRAELSKAWSRALYYDRLTALNQQNIARRQSNSQIVRLRYGSGRESKGSLLLTENAEQRAVVDFKDAKKKSILARGDLGVLVAVEIPDEEPLLGSLADEKWTPPGTDQHTPYKVAANEAKLAAARSATTEARLKYFPELALNASAKKSASPDLPLKEPVYTAGISMTIPIFDGQKDADVRAAVAKTSLLEITLSQSRRQADQSIRTAKANFESSRERFVVARKGLEATQLQAEVSRQRYTLGLMSFQDWDAFENALTKSELEVLNSEKDLADAVSDYLAAIGTTLEDGP